MAGVNFQLFYENNLEGEESTDGSGEAHFNEVPPGDVAVAEVLPDGYVLGIVYCTYHPADQGNDVAPDQMNVQDGFYFE
jgi:hypothetical protein